MSQNDMSLNHGQREHMMCGGEGPGLSEHSKAEKEENPVCAPLHIHPNSRMQPRRGR